MIIMKFANRVLNREICLKWSHFRGKNMGFLAPPVPESRTYSMYGVKSISQNLT